MKQFKRIEPTDITIVGDRFKREVVVKRYRTEDGLEHEFTTFESEGTESAVVIAITEDKKVVVVHQFRAGPEKWTYDLPGGVVDEGEAPLEAGVRELQEETAYYSDNITMLGQLNSGPYVNVTVNVFLALDCKLSPEGLSMDEAENTQGAEVKLISISELIANAKNNLMMEPGIILLAYDKLVDMEGSNESTN